MIDLKQIRNSGTLAPKASPELTGAPTAPTPLQDESNASRIATVGFVRTAMQSGGGSATLSVVDNGQGSVTMSVIGTMTLVATDNNNGNVSLSLT